MAKLKLKMLMLCGDTINLIINCAKIRYAINTGTLDMYYINAFHF